MVTAGFAVVQFSSGGCIRKGCNGWTTFESLCLIWALGTNTIDSKLLTVLDRPYLQYKVSWKGKIDAALKYESENMS